MKRLYNIGRKVDLVDVQSRMLSDTFFIPILFYYNEIPSFLVRIFFFTSALYIINGLPRRDIKLIV